jgi:hypothetical protein
MDFTYDVKAGFTMTREELDVCLELSANHYDAVCRMASIPGPGAFLHGYKTRFIPVQNEKIGSVTWSLSFDDLDILSKILEGRFHLPADKYAVTVKLEAKVRETIWAVRAEMVRLNNGAV